jgi:hypothetical protein
MRSINALAPICKPRTGFKHAASKTHLTDKLTNPGPAAEAEAETEFATQGETAIGEDTLFVGEVLTAAKAGEDAAIRSSSLMN